LLSREVAKKRKERNGTELTADGFIKDIERSKELVDPSEYHAASIQFHAATIEYHEFLMLQGFIADVEELYRIYCDATFFEHKVVLTRSNTDYRGKIYKEKYTIFVSIEPCIVFSYADGFPSSSLKAEPGLTYTA
jgi:hypothetical protein